MNPHAPTAALTYDHLRIIIIIIIMRMRMRIEYYSDVEMKR
jgi:hypothetical protein